MNELATLLNHIPWSAIWVAFGGGTAVTVVWQLLKKIFGLESEKVIQFLGVTLAFMASGLQYLLSSHSIAPSVLGVHTAVLLGVAQPLYMYFVKPLDSFINEVNAYNAHMDAVAASKVQAPADVTSTPTKPEPAKF